MTTQAPAHADWMPRAAAFHGASTGNAKNKVSAYAMLPAPLDEESLSLVLSELNHGSKRAVESCLDCWKERRLSDDDLLEFLRSISSQSETLASLFKKVDASAKDRSFEIASADDMAQLRALAESFGAPGGEPAPAPTKRAAEVAPPATALDDQAQGVRTSKRARFEAAPEAAPASEPAPAIDVSAMNVDLPHAPPAKAAPPKRTRRPKITEPTEEETRLMREWSERRVTEIARRQAETCGAPGKPKHLSFMLSELRRRLPEEEQGALLGMVRKYNEKGATPEELADFLKEQIQRHTIVVPLTHQAEVNVRPRKRVAPVKLAVGSDAIEMMKEAGSDVSSPDDAEGPGCAKKSCRGHSARHGVKGEGPQGHGVKEGTARTPEGGDDDARCPVCVSSPLDDDRWVKCDGCSTWYHQICVLFNELAHGKSVRFFCRTPGCRKRGSRQLNRRQRKPCYPTSLSLAADPLAEAVSAAAVPASRTDRSVVARVVSSSTSTRGDARKRSLTVMVFQHTMTGSDLLFLTAMVEVQGTKFSVVGADSNGLYEESYAGERAAVEVAVFDGLLHYARSAGCTTVSLSNPAAVDDFALFNGRPAAGAWGPGDAEATYEGALATGKQEGWAYGIHREGAGFAAKLRPPAGGARGAAPAPLEDMPCKVAGERESLVAMMDVNGYSFENLQCAKYASMMVVYHLAKGWKKEGARDFAQAFRPRGAAAAGGGSDEDMEEEEEEEEEEVFPVPPRVSSRQGSVDCLMSRQHSFDLSRQSSSQFHWGAASGDGGFASLRREGSNDLPGMSRQNSDLPLLRRDNSDQLRSRLQSFEGMIKSRGGSMDFGRTTMSHFDGGVSSGGAGGWQGGESAIEACFQTLVRSTRADEMQQPFGLRHSAVGAAFGGDSSFDMGRNITFDLSSKGSAPFEVAGGGVAAPGGSAGASKNASFDLQGKGFDSKSASFDITPGSKVASFDMHPSTPKSAASDGFDLTFQQPVHQVRTLDGASGSFWDDFRV